MCLGFPDKMPLSHQVWSIQARGVDGDPLSNEGFPHCLKGTTPMTHIRSLAHCAPGCRTGFQPGRWGSREIPKVGMPFNNKPVPFWFASAKLVLVCPTSDMALGAFPHDLLGRLRSTLASTRSPFFMDTWQERVVMNLVDVGHVDAHLLCFVLCSTRYRSKPY